MASSVTERRHDLRVMPQRGWWAAAGKRLHDLVLASLILVLGAPFFVLIALAIMIESPGSPLFVDDRVGLNARKFRMVKFRTMVPRATEHALGRKLVTGDPRITRVGALLRRFSLDEVPQVWNILIGDMSVVGPRPGLWEHLAQYDAYQRQRLLVRPGVTGLAQVSGRNNISWDERIEYDLDYIQRLSCLLDVRIVLATVGTVLGGRGITSAHQAKDTL